MNNTKPPGWLERILLSVLPPRHQETISGDLLEEFRERVAPARNRFVANVWYASQVVSFLPWWFSFRWQQAPALNLLCGFTAMAGLWLGFMDLRLKHPGYAGREVIAGTIVSQALLTLAALHLRPIPHVRTLVGLGCFALILLAAKAIVATLSGAHMEGYVILIAAALILQSVLTLGKLARPRRAHS